METSDRIKLLRKTLSLSQEAFGQALGVKKSAISKIENGENGLKEQMAKLICRTFNVDYFWLIEGTGEMFTALPETLFDELAEEYHLDREYKILLKTALEAPDDQKECIKNFLLTLAENLQKKDES